MRYRFPSQAIVAASGVRTVDSSRQGHRTALQYSITRTSLVMGVLVALTTLRKRLLGAYSFRCAQGVGFVQKLRRTQVVIDFLRRGCDFPDVSAQLK
jgi:hypothetical protein